MKQPCAKDCPERTEDCHATCERYKAFAADRLEKYAQRKRMHDELEMLFDARMRRKKREG